MPKDACPSIDCTSSLDPKDPKSLISPHVVREEKIYSVEGAREIQKKVEISCEETGFFMPSPLVVAGGVNVPGLEEIPIKGLSLEIGVPFPSQFTVGSPCSKEEQDPENATLEVVRDTFDS